MTPPVEPGSVLWAWLDPSVGREQSGRRPVLVVSSRDFNEVVDTLLIVLPISTTPRGWPNHVPVSGIESLVDGYVMTEQPRTISRERVGDLLGVVDATCWVEVTRWLGDFLEL